MQVTGREGQRVGGKTRSHGYRHSHQGGRAVHGVGQVPGIDEGRLVATEDPRHAHPGIEGVDEDAGGDNEEELEGVEDEGGLPGCGQELNLLRRGAVCQCVPPLQLRAGNGVAAAQGEILFYVPILLAVTARVILIFILQTVYFIFVL